MKGWYFLSVCSFCFLQRESENWRTESLWRIIRLCTAAFTHTCETGQQVQTQGWFLLLRLWMWKLINTSNRSDLIIKNTQVQCYDKDSLYIETMFKKTEEILWCQNQIWFCFCFFCLQNISHCFGILSFDLDTEDHISLFDVLTHQYFQVIHLNYWTVYQNLNLLWPNSSDFHSNITRYCKKWINILSVFLFYSEYFWFL